VFAFRLLTVPFRAAKTIVPHFMDILSCSIHVTANALDLRLRNVWVTLRAVNGSANIFLLAISNMTLPAIPIPTLQAMMNVGLLVLWSVFVVLPVVMSIPVTMMVVIIMRGV
jgi:hypothetical protein